MDAHKAWFILPRQSMEVKNNIVHLIFKWITSDKGMGGKEPGCYTIPGFNYMIYIFPKEGLSLRLRFLKCDGVSPVIFLNWFDRCATLL